MSPYRYQMQIKFPWIDGSGWNIVTSSDDGDDLVATAKWQSAVYGPAVGATYRVYDTMLESVVWFDREEQA